MRPGAVAKALPTRTHAPSDDQRWMTHRTSKRFAPRRVANGLRRRSFDALMRRHVIHPAPHPLELCGSDYGGWTIPIGEVRAGWVCICAGAGGDVTFEAELLHRTEARVVSVDPFSTFAKGARARLGHPHRYVFRVGALAAVAGTVSMTGRQDQEAGSVSAHGLHPGARFEIEAVTLESLLAELGESQVQLLKLDIEGSEYDVLRDADLVGLGVRVLCVELHHTAGLRAGRALLRSLEKQGLRCVHRRGSDFTLVRS